MSTYFGCSFGAALSPLGLGGEDITLEWFSCELTFAADC